MALVRIDPTTPQWFKNAMLQLEQVFLPKQPSAPLRLPVYATADLPNPAVWPNSLAYDSTLSQPVFSDGASWIPL